MTDLRKLAIPPNIDVPAIADAAETFQRRQRELLEAMQERYRLEQTVGEAAAADRAAFAAALADGKPDPGTKHADRHAKALAAMRRREEALGVVLAGAYDTFAAAVDGGEQEWSRKREEGKQRQLDTLRTLAEQLERELHVYAEGQATEAWLQGFPDHARWVPQRFVPKAAMAGVEAVKSLAEPPQRENLVQHQRAAWPGLGVPAAA